MGVMFHAIEIRQESQLGMVLSHHEREQMRLHCDIGPFKLLLGDQSELVFHNIIEMGHRLARVENMLVQSGANQFIQLLLRPVIQMVIMTP